MPLQSLYHMAILSSKGQSMNHSTMGSLDNQLDQHLMHTSRDDDDDDDDDDELFLWYG